jgi:predicted ester cyclase
MKIFSALKAAMPDLNIDIQQVKVNGNQASVKAQWSGTQTGPLSLPMPGTKTIPPTGKKVSVQGAAVITVQGDKVSQMHVEATPDVGIPALLAQLGVATPER